jgi:hypothetical protein
MAVLCLNSPRSTSVTCRITFLTTVVVDGESSKTSLSDHHRKSVNRNDPCSNLAVPDKQQKICAPLERRVFLGLFQNHHKIIIIIIIIKE